MRGGGGGRQGRRGRRSLGRLEYYIYETGSTLVTSLLPGQNMDADIAVSRDCDTQLLAAMNNYIYQHL